MKSQNEKILAYLKMGRAIDPLTAIQKFGIMRLAARVYDLKRDGFNIVAKNKQVKNRFGEICNVCVYKLIK